MIPSGNLGMIKNCYVKSNSMFNLLTTQQGSDPTGSVYEEKSSYLAK